MAFSGKKLTVIAVTALVFAVLLSALLPCAASGVSYAEPVGAADATTAGIYGGLDTDALWYFAQEELYLAKIREYVAVSILPVLRANAVEPVVIAVVDTGLDRGNSVFDGVLLRAENGEYLGYNSYYDAKGESSLASDITDESEGKHGTAVASIIALLIRETGLSDYIKIYPVKASYPKAAEDTSADITVNSFSRDNIRLGIANAISESIDADVINLSLCSKSGTGASWRNDAELQAVIAQAAQTATVVAAAGNETTSSDTSFFYPAAYDNVVGVMAQGRSGYHSSTNYGAAYDIFAPGEDILATTTNGEYNTSADGTSMAAPFVSFAAALFRLSLTAEDLASDFEMPRNSVITRMVTRLAENDATVTARDGKEYKKLDILKLISEDIDDIDYGWMDVTAMEVTAARNGKTVKSGAEIGLQTLRETGEGRSYLEFSVSLYPIGDTDPTLPDNVTWTLVEYEQDEDGNEEEASSTPLGTGGSIGKLFDKEGLFGVRATLTVGEGASAKTFEEEFRISVGAQTFRGSDAFIVEESYLSSDAYIRGTGGNITRDIVLYGDSKTMTFAVTTLEDVAYESVNWYVNGEIAATGDRFTFTPSGTPGRDFDITARVTLEDGRTVFVQNTLTVHYESLAAHPLFAILWTALGVGVIVGAVLLVRHHKKKKDGSNGSANGSAMAAEDGQAAASSPIRKK